MRPAQPSKEGLEEKVILVTMARAERRSRLRELARREDGSSLVEFALTLPMLLLVVTAIAAFGIAFNNYITLTEAASVGARQLIVSRGQTLDPCSTFSSAVYAAAPMLKQSSIAFTISLNGNSYSGTSCSGTATSGAPANMIMGTNAQVTVTYPLSINVYGMQIVPAQSLLTATTTELMQ
jgi:Flp pilus assembly protein TadG